MGIEIVFSGGKKVDAHVNGFVVKTDQPLDEGGEGSAPEPFTLFLVSIGTCMGYYVLSFCQKRNIPTQDIKLSLMTTRDTVTHLVSLVDIVIHVPKDFPEEYTNAIIKASETCAVRKHLQHPPQFHTTLTKN
jgi:ribosomal protein S12 methylthiotransferase accessory factor